MLILSRRDMGTQPRLVPWTSQLYGLEHLGSQSSLSVRKEALERGCFLYSDTLNVYPLVSDVFGEGRL